MQGQRHRPRPGRHQAQSNGGATRLPLRVIGLAITRVRGTRLGLLGSACNTMLRAERTSRIHWRGNVGCAWTANNAPRQCTPAPAKRRWVGVHHHAAMPGRTVRAGAGMPSTSINTLRSPFVGTFLSPPLSASSSQSFIYSYNLLLNQQTLVTLLDYLLILQPSK